MLKYFIAFILLVASGTAGAQRVLEFRNDLLFNKTEIDAIAAHAFGARLRSLAGAGKLDPDPALKARLQRIFPRLLRAAAYERPAAASLAWEIHACSNCNENAMAMPGGKVLVSAEFIRNLGLTDDELAYLLAHEMAHVLAEHTREFATAARYFVDNGLARDYADIQHELTENLPVLLRMAQVSVLQELDADYIGFILGAHAGFAPDAMISLLEKLGNDGPSLFGTHPTPARRMKQARTMLDAARRLANSSTVADGLVQKQ
jgi:predicted Zn-dependent protease